MSKTKKAGIVGVALLLALGGAIIAFGAILKRQLQTVEGKQAIQAIKEGGLAQALSGESIRSLGGMEHLKSSIKLEEITGGEALTTLDLDPIKQIQDESFGFQTTVEDSSQVDSDEFATMIVDPTRNNDVNDIMERSTGVSSSDDDSTTAYTSGSTDRDSGTSLSTQADEVSSNIDTGSTFEGML